MAIHESCGFSSMPNDLPPRKIHFGASQNFQLCTLVDTWSFCTPILKRAIGALPKTLPRAMRW